MASVRNWDDLVEEGRQLKIMEERVEAEHGNIRWQWGDLLLDVAPVGKDGAHNGSTEALQRYADELDLSFQTLRAYRQVAAAWPPDMRVSGEPWTVHQMFAARDNREEMIRNPVDVRTGERLDHWTFRAAQRALGNKASPHYRKPPQTSAEKLAEINAMIATIGDDEAVEFVDRVVDLLEALDERTPRPAPADPPPLDQRWESAIKQLDRVLTNLAKLNNETDEAGATLSGHAAAARYLYERIAEKKVEAEIRQFFESEGIA